MPIKKIHNLETNEIIECEMTQAELKQRELDEKAALLAVQTNADKEDAKAALLARLGITADEAKLLLS